MSMNIFTSAYFKKDFVVIVNFVKTEYDWIGIHMNIHEMDEIRQVLSKCSQNCSWYFKITIRYVFLIYPYFQK